MLLASDTPQDNHTPLVTNIVVDSLLSCMYIYMYMYLIIGTKLALKSLNFLRS